MEKKEQSYRFGSYFSDDKRMGKIYKYNNYLIAST